MSGNVINLECRQLDADSVAKNGQWSTTLAKPVEIANGDILELNRIFIDNVSQSDGKVVIEEDIKATLTFNAYVTSIEHPNTSLLNNGHYYEAHPERDDDPTLGVDGADYIMCKNFGQDVYPTQMKYVTLIRVGSVRNYNNDYMGDETQGDETQPLTISFYDYKGNPQDANFFVPWTHVSGKGMTLNVETAFLMDVNKGFFVKPQNRNQWDGKVGKPLLPQNVNPDGIVILTAATPTANFLHPILINRDILIAKGSYAASDIVSVLNDSLQSNHESGQFAVGSGDFPVNPLLRQSGSMDGSTYYVSNRTALNSSRIMTPNDTVSVNFWVGSNQINLDYDIPSNKFFFKYLHMPFYTTSSGAISSNYQIDSDSDLGFFVGKNSGIALASMTATVNDPKSMNYGQYYDFWYSKLGFVENLCCSKFSYGNLMTINTVEYTIPVFTNWGAGLSTTEARGGIDNVIKKDSDPQIVPSVTEFFSLAELTTPVVATEARLGMLDMAFGYFLIEVSGGLSSELISSVNINQNISAIINRYYSLGSFTSGDASSSLQYVHSGASVYLKNLKFRILNSDRTPSENLDADNTVFINVIKAAVSS
jgi:hypothetical protein